MQVLQVIDMRKPKFITWEEVDGFLITRMVHDSKAAAKDKETVEISHIHCLLPHHTFWSCCADNFSGCMLLGENCQAPQ